MQEERAAQQTDGARQAPVSEAQAITGRVEQRAVSAEPHGKPRAAHVDVEISIVNHSSRELLRDCLLSLPDACEGLEWRVAVVDNASSDGSVEMLERLFPNVDVVRNSRRYGFAVNQNQILVRAVNSGSARYVLALNNDARLLPGAVGALVACGDANPQLGAIGPRTFNTDGSPQASSFRFPSLRGALNSMVGRSSDAFGCGETSEAPAWLAGSCLLLRTTALQDVGCFDSRFFMFFEDIDLCRRLLASGWRLAVCDTARLIHHNHGTVSRPDMRFDMECQLRRSSYLYVQKYYGRLPASCLAGIETLSILARAASAGLSRADREHGRFSHLWRLSLYNPSRPLPHESEGE